MNRSIIPGAQVSVGVPPPSSSLNLNSDDWKSFQFHFRDFASLNSTQGHWVGSPTFTCNCHHWRLSVYPGGIDEGNEGKVSIYLHMMAQHDSGAGEGSITAEFQFDIIDKLGKNRKYNKASHAFPTNVDSDYGYGWGDFVSRSDTLNNDIIGSGGDLTIVVSIKEELTTTFVPKNSAPNMTDTMFNDETTADVCFEVANASHTEEGMQKKQKSSVSFHAHRLILRKFAPILAELVPTNDKFSITDIEPDVFHHLLYYVYGGKVPDEELKKHAKDIIDAADKYAIVNLKLAAEVAYVESTDITIDNALENLLYADGKNCALLQEKVMNFLADHPNEAAEKISFADCPGYMIRDILIAVGRNSKEKSSEANVDELSTLSVSALRRKLHEKGLDVDGSREAMIESLKNSNASSR